LFSQPFYTLAIASKIYNVLKATSLDIIHVHYAIPHTPSALIARQMFLSSFGGKDLKIITTLHGTDIELLGIDPSYKEITKYSLEKSDGITAVSNHLKRSTVEKFGINKERIKLIYNFVDLKRFNDSHRDELIKQSVNEGLIVHISNFRKVKRVSDTVSVFKAVREKIPCRLLLVGDGPERQSIEEMVKKMNLTSMIDFVGCIPDVQQILKIADIFLLTSEMESFGLGALEAMACGVPVVATKTGGLPEVVKEGESGFLVEFGNIEKYAQCCITLLKDRQLNYQFGKEGARIAKERFSIEKIVAQYEHLYNEIKGYVPLSEPKVDMEVYI
jgi:N-acetyl-alpha-D-glucosaminyl L-malate synthase BshA